MYNGSMVGAGLDVFAVWGYILANARRGMIELNPKLLAFILGGTEQEVAHAIRFLCQPDDKSRSKAEGGRRLIKESEYQYRVVNWNEYQQIKNEGERREYNRRKQLEYRERQKRQKQTPLTGENEHIKLAEAGASEAKLAKQVESHLPISAA
jgi:hypothetical protein